MRALAKLLALLLALGLATCAMAQPSPPPHEPRLMTWPDLHERPRPAPDSVIRSGEDARQVVDLYMPEGPDPYPVVVMIHGGC